MFALIVAVSLAASGPPDGALPVIGPAESATAVQSFEQLASGVAPGVCEADVKLALPPPCSCDGGFGLGCGAERVAASGPNRVRPSWARRDTPPTVGSMNDLFDPIQSSPPPRRSS